MVALFSTGCWDKKEFNKISFVDAMAIDRKDDEIIVTLQINVPKNMKDGGEGGPLWIISGHGRTIVEAIDDIVSRSPREIYWGQLNVALLGESILSDDVGKAVDFFARNNQFRKRNHILAVQGSAQEILEAKPNLVQANYYYMSGLIEDQEKRVKDSTVDFNQVMIAMSTPGLDMFIPQLSLVKGKEIAQTEKSQDPPAEGEAAKKEEEKDSSAKLLQLSGGALVKDEKLVGWVDSQWCRGYYWIVGNIRKGTITVESPLEGSGIYTFKTKETKCKISLVNDQPLTLKLDVSAQLDLSEYSNFQTQTSRTSVMLGKKQMKLLEEAVNIAIKQEITDSVQKARELNCDPFGFGQWVNAYHPKTMANQDWENYMQDLQIEVVVDAKLKMSIIIN